MRKPNWVVNDCRETDADEEQDDYRSRARLQRPLVSMMRVYAALGRLPTWLLKPGVLASLRFPFAFLGVNERYGDFSRVKRLVSLCASEIRRSGVHSHELFPVRLGWRLHR
jgi:hypothetical protein